MFVLALGLVLMLGVHVFASLRARAGGGRADRRRPLSRSPLAGRALGLALVVWGFIRYRADAWDQIWAPPEHARDLTWTLMWFALVSLACVFDKAPGKHPRLAAPPAARLGDVVVARRICVERRRGRHAAVRRVLRLVDLRARRAGAARRSRRARRRPPSPEPTRSSSSSARCLWARSPCSTPISPACRRSTGERRQAGFPLSRRRGVRLGSPPSFDQGEHKNVRRAALAHSRHRRQRRARAGGRRRTRRSATTSSPPARSRATIRIDIADPASIVAGLAGGGTARRRRLRRGQRQFPAADDDRARAARRNRLTASAWSTS